MRHRHHWTWEQLLLGRTTPSWRRSLKKFTMSAMAGLTSTAGTCSMPLSNSQSSRCTTSSTCSSTGSTPQARKLSTSRAARRQTRSSLVLSRRWTPSGEWWRSRPWTMGTHSMSSTGCGIATITSATTTAATATTTATTIKQPTLLPSIFPLSLYPCFFPIWLDLPLAFSLLLTSATPVTKERKSGGEVEALIFFSPDLCNAMANTWGGVFVLHPDDDQTLLHYHPVHIFCCSPAQLFLNPCWLQHQSVMLWWSLCTTAVSCMAVCCVAAPTTWWAAQLHQWSRQAGSCRDHLHCQESFGSLVAASCSVRPRHRKLAKSTALFSVDLCTCRCAARRSWMAAWLLFAKKKKKKKTHCKQRYSNSSFSLTHLASWRQWMHSPISPSLQWRRTARGHSPMWPWSDQKFSDVCMYVCVWPVLLRWGVGTPLTCMWTWHVGSWWNVIEWGQSNEAMKINQIVHIWKKNWEVCERRGLLWHTGDGRCCRCSNG